MGKPNSISSMALLTVVDTEVVISGVVRLTGKEHEAMDLQIITP